MNFIEFLAELQTKYDIPNAEILEEMQLQGIHWFLPILDDWRSSEIGRCSFDPFSGFH